MNTTRIDAIARAVLYEGYMLYPYRPSSVKNRQRFNFGVLYPRAYSEAQSGDSADAWSMQTECLVEGDLPMIEVRVRFLKLIARTVSPLGTPEIAEPVASWQEASECEVTVPARDLQMLATSPLQHSFTFPAKEQTDLLRDENGQVVGVVERTQESLCGAIEVEAFRLDSSLFKLRVSVKNNTALDNPALSVRDRALMQSLVSAHTILGVRDGHFVSLLDPPENLKEIASTCVNQGAWPVLVGEEGERDTLLASPIILYDYPQIAPESPGDLFDGTEIDEILALRIMTMTDDEKREMRATDDRARKILERTESLSMEHLAKLHGTLRDLRRLTEETQ